MFSTEDYIIVAEFSQIDGPLAIAVIPPDILTCGVDIEAFVLRIMSVAPASSPSVEEVGKSIPEDEIVLCHPEQNVFAFIRYVCVRDFYARGLIRPLALCYVSSSAEKIRRFRTTMSVSFAEVSHHLRSGSLDTFSRDYVSHIETLKALESIVNNALEQIPADIDQDLPLTDQVLDAMVVEPVLKKAFAIKAPGSFRSALADATSSFEEQKETIFGPSCSDSNSPIGRLVMHGEVPSFEDDKTVKEIILETPDDLLKEDERRDLERIVSSVLYSGLSLGTIYSDSSDSNIRSIQEVCGSRFEVAYSLLVGVRHRLEIPVQLLSLELLDSRGAKNGRPIRFGGYSVLSSGLYTMVDSLRDGEDRIEGNIFREPRSFFNRLRNPRLVQKKSTKGFSFVGSIMTSPNNSKWLNRLKRRSRNHRSLSHLPPLAESQGESSPISFVSKRSNSPRMSVQSVSLSGSVAPIYSRPILGTSPGSVSIIGSDESASSFVTAEIETPQGSRPVRSSFPVVRPAEDDEDLVPGQGLLYLRYRYSFLPQIVFCLLCGVPLAVRTTGNFVTAMKVINALSIFVFDDGESPTIGRILKKDDIVPTVRYWSDFYSIFGAASTVDLSPLRFPYASLDIDSDVFVGPRVPGKCTIVQDVIARQAFFPNESSYMCHVYSQISSLAHFGQLYYHLHYIGIPLVPGKGERLSNGMYKVSSTRLTHNEAMDRLTMLKSGNRFTFSSISSGQRTRSGSYSGYSSEPNAGIIRHLAAKLHGIEWMKEPTAFESVKNPDPHSRSSGPYFT